MLIGELADRSGVAPATIKYYVREGLLPAGERISGNQTDYTDAHLRRLRLIRALLEVGKLSSASVLEVLTAFDDPDFGLGHAFEIAQRVLSRDPVPVTSNPSPGALAQVAALVQRAGWGECGISVGATMVARVIDASTSAGFPLSDDYLDRYAAGAQSAADADFLALQGQPDRERTAEIMVVGTVFGDPLFAGLRRIAQAHLSTFGSWHIGGSGSGSPDATGCLRSTNPSLDHESDPT